MFTTNPNFVLKIRAWISGAPALGRNVITRSACLAVVVLSGVAVQTNDPMLLVALLKLMLGRAALTR